MCNAPTDAICDRIAEAIHEQWSVGSDRTIMTLMVQQAVRDLLEPVLEPTVALVTVDEMGRLTPESTVTVGEETWRVPEWAWQGGYQDAARLGEALEERGWRRVVGGENDYSQPGVIGVPVEPIETNEQ